MIKKSDFHDALMSRYPVGSVTESRDSPEVSLKLTNGSSIVYTYGVGVLHVPSFVTGVAVCGKNDLGHYLDMSSKCFKRDYQEIFEEFRGANPDDSLFVNENGNMLSIELDVDSKNLDEDISRALTYVRLYESQLLDKFGA